MLLRLVALLLLAAPLSWGYGLHAAPRSLAAASRTSAATMGSGSINLKTKVKRAAMAAKGRHRLCVFKYARRLGLGGARIGSARSRVRPAPHAQRARHPPRAPRRSNKHIYAQVIDDATHRILVAASSVEADLKEKGLNIETAKEVGSKAAARAKEKGIELVYFDRNGFKYHGRVAALADAAREGGLQF